MRARFLPFGLAALALGCGLDPSALSGAGGQACPAGPSSPAAPVGGQVRVPLSALDAGSSSRLEFPGAQAELGLEGLNGAPLPGVVALADAQGRYTLPGVPADQAVVVSARVKRADGVELQLKALVQVGPGGGEASPSAASTLVVEALAQVLAQSPLPSGQGGRLDAQALAKLVASAEVYLKSVPPVDWAKPAAVEAAARAALSQGAFAEAIAQVHLSLGGDGQVARASATALASGLGLPSAGVGVQVRPLSGGLAAAAVVRGLQGEALRLPGLAGLAFDDQGKLYVADPLRHRILVLSPEGDNVFSARVLVGGLSGWQDGAFGEARFLDPRDLAWDGRGGLLVVEALGQRLRRVDLDAQSVSTLAGDGVAGHADGAGAISRLDHPVAVAVDVGGNATLLAEGHGQVVRRLGSDGQVATLAGQALRRGRADGPGAQARFFSPQGIAVDLDGRVYVSDTANHAIRMLALTADGQSAVATLAGTPAGQVPEGMPGAPAFADGQGIAAAFSSPQGLAFDAESRRLLVADTGNRRIRAIDLANGQVSTVAGSGLRGSQDGPALSATFDAPTRLAVSADGLLAIADPGVGRLALLRLRDVPQPSTPSPAALLPAPTPTVQALNPSGALPSLRPSTAP